MIFLSHHSNPHLPPPQLKPETTGVENKAMSSWTQSELAYNTFRTETTLTESMSEIDGPNMCKS